MATYTLGGRTPTLYSLFETKENIQLCGTQTKLSKQRYLAAWDFSAQLCAIEHPGIAPCFFPSDFSLFPGRRSPELIALISDNCPSFLFYHEYRQQMMQSIELMQQPESSKECHTESPNCRPIIKSSRISVSAANIQSELGSFPDSQPSILETMVSHPHDKSVTWKEDIPLKRLNLEKRQQQQQREHGSLWMGLRLRKSGGCNTEIEEREVTKSEGGTAVVDENVLGTVENSSKRLFLKNIDWLRRSFVRNCMGRRGEIVIDASRWPKAEETFISRLTGEFYELEKLISDFLEVL